MLSANRMENTRRALALQKRYNHDPAAVRFDDLLPHDTLRGVVAAFDKHGGAKSPDNVQRCFLLEKNDHVHAVERGEDGRAVFLPQNGAFGSLEG